MKLSLGGGGGGGGSGVVKEYFYIGWVTKIGSEINPKALENKEIGKEGTSRVKSDQSSWNCQGVVLLRRI